MNHNNFNLMSLEEVAATLHVGTPTIRNYCRQGKLRFRKIGRRILISRDELERFIGPELVKPSPAQSQAKTTFSSAQLERAMEKFGKL
jgi:excisionase family DNA binding protein